MERRAIAIQGAVQGVGFRPFVFGLASRLNLRGFVRNSSGGVKIELEGEPPQLDQFLCDLERRPPPLARIENLSWERQKPRGDLDFKIQRSVPDPSEQAVISPDAATCDDCVAELFDPANRRYRYPFLNCTNCGPRLTIVTGVPYDRDRTTMAAFTMCPACRAEYEDPADRRFHAQPTACATCGPALAAADERGKPLAVDDPLNWFVAHLRDGRIGAMKGLGGYHLVCDARNEHAVATLRKRKHRDEKPLAVMVASAADADAICQLHPADHQLLTSPQRPIVLLKKKINAGLSPQLAPGNPMLGVMLPYTPLHHLLLREFGGALVMTSGNRSDEPIATSEPEVFDRLAGIADIYLTHNRPIHVRCDDSVTRTMSGIESPIRRSRGYAPRPIRLPSASDAPILAVGAQLKGTFALARRGQAFVSHHLGDLDHFEAFRAFEKDIELYQRLLAIHPRYIAHDLHPDYASTRYALKRAKSQGLEPIAIQHHHAHIASCMAEHGRTDPVIGVSFDGTGYGTDGAVWGGEFLVADLRSFRRAAHFRYVRMPGGEKAIKEPWRMALAYLADAAADCPSLTRRIDARAAATAAQMLHQNFNSPPTSSVGRLFDAVASLLSCRDAVTFEGQAAMELEWLAATAPPDGEYRIEIAQSPLPDAPMQLDARQMITEITADIRRNVPAAIIARRFHRAIADSIARVCQILRDITGIDTVALGGGVFMNELLRSEIQSHLNHQGFHQLLPRLLPPNDAGVSFGQIAIAASRLGGQPCA